MCVQFMIRRTLDEISRLYGAQVPEEFEFKPHVFPRYRAPVIGWGGQGPVIKPYHFGLIPFFEKNSRPKSVFHNARIETVHEKPSFRKAFLKQRCLVPLDSFLEVIPEESGGNHLSRFFPESGRLLTAAGLYSTWRSPEGERIPTFTLLTREAPPFIRTAGHDRCPVFLREECLPDWIEGGEKRADELFRILEQGAEEVAFAEERIEKPRA
jgi:putative SOS response-associated peptidase YedK